MRGHGRRKTIYFAHNIMHRFLYFSLCTHFIVDPIIQIGNLTVSTLHLVMTNMGFSEELPPQELTKEYFVWFLAVFYKRLHNS